MGMASSSVRKSDSPAWGRTSIRVAGFREFVRKTTLLNLGVVLSSLAIGAYPRRPAEFVIILFLVTTISGVAWSASLAISALATLPRIIRTHGVLRPSHSPRR